MRILHVEDDPTWLATLRDVLKRAGHEVTSFNNLPAAKKAYEEGQRWDVYLCDTNILGEDGSEWALYLHRRGEKVLSIASHTQEDVPLFSKGDFGLKGNGALIAAIEAL